MKISKRTVDAAAVPDRADAYYWDTDLKGFGLRVTPRGVKSYVFQYRLKGRPARRLTIGKHGGLTPEAARTIAQRHAVTVASGVDPVEVERKRARDARELGFEGYLDRFTEQCLKPEWPDSWQDTRRLLENHALRHLRGRAITEIEPGHVRSVIDPLRDRKALARKTWAVLSRLFSFAIEEQDLPRALNPMDGLRAPPKPDDRKRVLSPDEIVAAWKASYEIGEPWGRFVRLLFATLQRRTEVAGAPWKELDRERAAWVIDAGRAKNDEDHLCPLNALALAELEAVGWKSRGPLLSTDGKTSISGFSKMKAKIDAAMLPILQELSDKRTEALGEDPHPVTLERWTLHDIRRTGSTGMQALGIPVEVADRCLNHKTEEAAKGSRRPYFLWRYEPEKRRALDAWGAHLAKLIEGADASAIIPFAERRA